MSLFHCASQTISSAICHMTLPRIPGIVPASLLDSTLAVAAAVDKLRLFVNGERSVAVITGAGLSTESGVPDYRSPQGSYSKGHKPMQHAEFMRSLSKRKRYWARSLIGWRWFASAKPNRAHLALAQLERIGWIASVITQNVDRLHKEAGSLNVTELHGTTKNVECMSCGVSFPRLHFQSDLELRNRAWIDEWLSLGDVVDIRADGDAHISASDFANFEVPNCTKCGGIIKPSVVFFGGAVPEAVKESAMRQVMAADRLLVAGSSLMVFSSFKLAKAAHKAGKELLILNIGTTRADDLATTKIEGRCGEVLPLIVPSGVAEI
eukprot:TRINITY_DN75745_c0_g1_i1.p1 TRINITY_DN75745_c0_g1~~TRINITY_DN75745_c0_g1_i1.p1  ORF type:complete len:322 (-),score=48.48 TRINITY_DN75745_c0_g1_i1:139-1104(-)